MAATAGVTHEWGFVFLETVWATVSLWGIWNRLSGDSPQAADERRPS
jgi:hypothetical protein